MPDPLASLRKRLQGIPAGIRLAIMMAALVLVPVMPFFGDPWIRVFALVGIYVILGLGLNVVVGFAGLLDLGFVAFFAAGAYGVGVLSSPSSPFDLTLNFWLVLPIAVLIGATLGLLLGLPVLPLRGDYLAIVTLGFGEIIRLFLTNREDITNGSQGISAIGTPTLPFKEFDTSTLTSWYYLIVVAAVLVAFVTARMRDSRIGRAWEAIREDEDVAAAMGIDTTKYKLMAFAMGAAIGAFGGAFYASFFNFINPSAFTLDVSVRVLALVIIGGMGSTPGVVFGAFILIGVPDILQFEDTSRFLGRFGLENLGRDIADKRFIIFGALLVAIMVLRPSGLFPAKRGQREFAAARQDPPGVPA